MEWNGSTRRRIVLLALAIGLATRFVGSLLTPEGPLTTCDGAAYWNLASNLAAGHGLSISDPHVAHDLCELPLGPSHHYSPLFPAWEAAFIVVFGPSVATLVASNIALSIGAVFSVYVLTRNLYGEETGLLVAAAISLEWSTIHYGVRGYSENLVLVTVAVTMWAILRSLQDERYILIAGVSAGLGYLSKASVGWFFLIAGGAGLAWRLWHRGPKAAFNRWYVTAIVLFGAIVGAWILRNLHLFWDGTYEGLWLASSSSVPTTLAVHAALQEPGRLMLGLAGKFVVLLPALAIPLLPLWPQLRAALATWRDEATSALLLATSLIFVIGWFLAAALWTQEHTRILWGDPIRYVAPAVLAMLWLAVDKRIVPASTPRWMLVYAIELALLPGLSWFTRVGHFLGR